VCAGQGCWRWKGGTFGWRVCDAIQLTVRTYHILYRNSPLAGGFIEQGHWSLAEVIIVGHPVNAAWVDKGVLCLR
jgi:hypothetical protein